MMLNSFTTMHNESWPKPYRSMRNRLTVYGLWIFIYIRFAPVNSESLKWSLKSHPIVFGEEVQLFCNGNTCQPNTIKKWIGGPSYQLLCFGGYSADYSKYEMMVNDTITEFGLMIKNITVEDTFCRYTCACGLHQYTATLDLEGVDYIYPPDIHYYSINRSGTYHVEIELDVYPFPHCILTYERNIVPVNITKPKHSTKRGYLSLYNVHIIHTIDMHSFICKGEFLFTCNIGKRNYTLIHQSIDWCKDEDKPNIKVYAIIGSILGTVSVIVIVSILYFLKIRKGKKTDTSVQIEVKDYETFDLRQPNQVRLLNDEDLMGRPDRGISWNNLVPKLDLSYYEIKPVNTLLNRMM